MEKRKKRSTSKRSVANFTEDLIIDILLCLPAKSIARFRCVCKSWYNLLTRDISFTTMKFNHDTRKGCSKLLLTTRERNKDTRKDVYNMQLRSVVSNKAVHLFENRLPQKIQILGSCNGLICASNKGHGIYVSNPCTKESKVILSKPNGYQTYWYFMNDGFMCCGLGYDSKTCDYKFVSILSRRGMDVSQAEIYYLGSDSWKRYNSCIPYKIRRGESGDPGVFLNGALHWMAQPGNDTLLRPQVILSFGIEDEIFKEIPQPEQMFYLDHTYVDVLRGCLCLLCSVSKVGFEIWVMKDYGVRESWSKLFKTDQQLMTTLGINIPSYRYLRNVVSLPDGETLLHVRSYGNKKRPVFVKMCLDEKERHQDRRTYRYMKYMVQMVAYTETLVSVNSNTQQVGDAQEQKISY